ncbi:hypothetical protein HG535_0D02380 [Zygotorulaspora mrakii]|uniref:histidinol-phosphate transaminase n=1 Tax=Zygotorulaspora mrakii TaxID=42260 RepID=A0A7H9B1M7_ZYGMR|nr:uncharacterized protein HG535_0D02380 [Zygotorulaspora mrakii]QLG72530.1 hypothetical protein HG535_0D02380 [Zygotorulaspora mrakii]
MAFDLQNIVRPKIYNLEPYRCARDDFQEGILLDANENAHGPVPQALLNTSLHRYPDPHQIQLKNAIAEYRNKTNSCDNIKEELTAENLCFGVGSDESIDALIRACCVPGKDKILVLPPTYSMYSVSSSINDVEVVKCPLIVEDNSFQMNTDAVHDLLKKDPLIKIVFLTSPGNPTGAKIETSRIEQLLQSWDKGMVVVDEAYIDFSGGSTAALVNKYPNICVLQTLSKSFGLAGIRLGITFSSKEMSRVLNAMKAPYNISSSTSEFALKAFEDSSLKAMEDNAKKINTEKLRLLKRLTSLKNVDDEHVGGLDANFLMIRIKDGDNELAQKLYYKLATESKVVVRFRGNELGCSGCLRITVGTPEENDILFREFSKILAELTAA